MKETFGKFCRLTQVKAFLWPLFSALLMGFLVGGVKELSLIFPFMAGFLFGEAALFSYASIEEAPLDVLEEGRNLDNPIAKGQLSIRQARILGAVSALFSILLAGISSAKTILVLTILFVFGGIYFHHSLKLRQNPLLDNLGFVFLVGILPFFGALCLGRPEMIDKVLPPGALVCVLAFGIYLSSALNFQEEKRLPSLSKVPFLLLITSYAVLVLSIYTFMFSSLVPPWVAVLLSLVFAILSFPLISHRRGIQAGTFLHALLAVFQKALVIALATFTLVPPIIEWIRSLL
ncbi:MAG: UbiA family prenyltransferase [Anaerolineaceae bacterium]|nr:UbiA family prenyltransferase [Anaerolineaceae bacterium]